MEEPVILQFPLGPVVEGVLPGDFDSLPLFLRVAVANATRLKWCLVAEFCVFFILGLTNLYLMLLPWLGVVGWFAVNNFQPRTIAVIAIIHIALSFLGSLCLGLQIGSGSSKGVCELFFDVSSGDHSLAQAVLVLLILFALSAVGTISWKFRAYIIANLAHEDLSRLIALS